MSATTQAQSGKSCPNSNEASPVQVKTPTEVQEEATAFLANGKRHLSMSNIPAAVTSLAHACDLLSAQFGETAKECAEAYFHYGRALLELSKLTILGSGLDAVCDEGESQDDANISRVEAAESLTSAINIIDERMKNIIKEGNKPPKKSPIKAEKDVTGLKALIPEIEDINQSILDKIADMKKEAEAKAKDGSEELSSSSGDKTSVAVKRKADDEVTKSKKVVADKDKTAPAN